MLSIAQTDILCIGHKGSLGIGQVASSCLRHLM